MLTELPARVGRRSSRESSLQQFMCEFTNGKWPAYSGVKLRLNAFSMHWFGLWFVCQLKGGKHGP